MGNILVLDACIRKEQSRTRQLMDQAIQTWRRLRPEDEIKVLTLGDMQLQCHSTASLAERDDLMKEGHLDHPRFYLAHEFAQADGIMVAAPFWDLSIPAILKVYIENISVDGITFGCNEEGMYGKCRADWMLYLTTRGGICQDTELEQGTPYLEALCKMFGIDELVSVWAEGLDIMGIDAGERMQEALEQVEHTCRSLLQFTRKL